MHEDGGGDFSHHMLHTDNILDMTGKELSGMEWRKLFLFVEREM